MDPTCDRSRRAPAKGLHVLVLPLLDVMLLALLFLFSIEQWGALPERVSPAGLGGTPEGWASGFLGWFALPLVGAGILLIFLGIQSLRQAAFRRPWIASIPRGAVFRALPPEARERIVSASFSLLWLFPLPVLAFLLYGQWAILSVARGRMNGLPWPPLLFFLVGVLLALAAYLAVLDSRVQREAREAGIPPGGEKRKGTGKGK